MARPSSSKFSFGKGIYYFNIKKGYNNSIIIKRTTKKNAVDAYQSYLKIHKDNCEWMGKWDGKKFIEDNVDSLVNS